jgi:methyltransferase-like protein 6
LGDSDEQSEQKRMLEVGCGVGNLIFPLIADKCNNYFIYACDFSPRAVEFVKGNELYDSAKMNAFTCDITKPDIFNEIPTGSLDIITMIFVLSAIHPNNFQQVSDTLFKLLKPNGVLLFRDYGLYDMAQLRFKPGNKIADNLYMRQDGTRSYFFSLDETKTIFESSGFEILQNNFIERRTINKKENINVQRWFLQGKYRKPS